MKYSLRSFCVYVLSVSTGTSIDRWINPAISTAKTRQAGPELDPFLDTSKKGL